MSSTPASSPGWASDDYLGGARWPRRSLDPGSRQEDRLKGYWLILGAEVSDQEAQKEYGALWAPIAQRYEARLIAGSDAVKLIEARDAARVLLVEFPSFAAAQACYDDPDYERARAFALLASKRSLVLLRGELG